MEKVELCTTCRKPMLDGEPVTMDWAGNAVSHISCPNGIEVLADVSLEETQDGEGLETLLIR